jgi:hypothetical protein
MRSLLARLPWTRGWVPSTQADRSGHHDADPPPVASETMHPARSIAYMIAAFLWAAAITVFLFEPEFAQYSASGLEPRLQFAGHVELTRARRPDWYRSAAVGTFKIENRSNYSVKSLSIECLFSSADGSNEMWVPVTLNDIVSSQSERQISNVDLGYLPPRAHNSQCDVFKAVKL